MVFDITPLPDPPPYFNTGVMLIRPSTLLWQQLVGNVTLVPHGGVHADPDYLNAYLRGRICTVPRKYNYIVAGREQFGATVVIVHYSGYTNIKVYSRFNSWWKGLNDLLDSWDKA